MDRRSFIRGLVSVAAPAVVLTPGLLMPLRGIVMPQVEPFLHRQIALGYTITMKAICDNLYEGQLLWRDAMRDYDIIAWAGEHD